MVEFNSRQTGIDVEKAILYVKKHANRLELLRLQHFLREMNYEEAIDILSKYQFPNGGWYYEDDPKKVLSIGASTLWLRVLIELGLEDTETVEQTARFLFENQCPDGSWYELKEKLKQSPQAWLQEDLIDNRLWFTISATVFLTACSFGSHSAVRKATDYLSSWWDEHKTFRITWYPFWAGIPFFARTRGYDSQAFSSCYEYTMKRLSMYDAFHLGWVLNMCKFAGLPATDTLVRNALDRLGELQRTDGAWSSKYGEAQCTLFALNMLRHYDRI